ncbi:MAG: response regulator [Anaerolineae bacterium]
MAKILLIEDDQIIRKILSKRLRKKAFEVVVANDGLEGIAKARTERPDLILMDMRLPHLNGWQATAQLKADLETREIPIIALTAATMDFEQQRSLDAGCVDCFTKPINFSSLLARIEMLLNPN